MKYFSRFKNIQYTLDDDRSNFKSVKNIFTKVKFIQEVLENTDLYYEYQSKESDNPEIIASKLYKDPNRYWMIMMGNAKIDPYFDVPLKRKSFENYLIQKYGSIETSKTQLHSYEKITEITTNRNGLKDTKIYTAQLNEKTYNQSTKSIENNTLPTLSNPILVIETKQENIDGVDITTVIKHVFVTAYEHELRVNESKREVRLLRPNLVSRVEQEFKTLLRN